MYFLVSSAVEAIDIAPQVWGDLGMIEGGVEGSFLVWVGGVNFNFCQQGIPCFLVLVFYLFEIEVVAFFFKIFSGAFYAGSGNPNGYDDGEI